MKYAKLIVIILAILLFSISFSILATAEEDTMSKPEWKVGDTWTYDGTLYSDEENYSGEVTFKIDEKTTIKIEGTTYEVYKSVLTSIFEKWVYYYDTETLSLLKSIRETILPGESNWDVTDTNFKSIWPLYLNKSVNWTTKRIYVNDTKSWTGTLDVVKKCTAIVNITTPAGEFRCFEVKTYTDDTLEHIDYWSAETKGTVRHYYYDEDGDLARESTFKSYGDSDIQTPNQTNNNNDQDNRILLTILLVFLASVLAVLFYKIHKSKKR